jgi:hypothetical protein
VLADDITCIVREGSGRVPFAKSQDGQFAVLLKCWLYCPANSAGNGKHAEPGASILRVGHLFAEGAVS